MKPAAKLEIVREPPLRLDISAQQYLMFPALLAAAKTIYTVDFRECASSNERRTFVVTGEDLDDAATVYAEFRNPVPGGWGTKARWDWQVWPQSKKQDLPIALYVALVWAFITDNSPAPTENAAL